MVDERVRYLEEVVRVMVSELHDRICRLEKRIKLLEESDGCRFNK